MPTIHLLGTGAARTDAHRTTTMLALTSGGRTLLIDCGGDVIQRTQAAGIDLASIDGLFITHEHPDHVGGFPVFVEKIWLCGRTRAIDLYGIAPALSQASRCFSTYDTSHWTLPELRWHEVAHEEGALVLENDDWRITASPGVHGVPVVGLRMEHRPSGAVAVYSCDTEPTPSIERLAAGADLLIHEANGAMTGHSSNEQAAGVAARAGVNRLVLVHLPPGTRDEDLAAARSIFPDIRFGDELEQYEF